jgi:preprotein translocase subunit SecB
MPASESGYNRVFGQSPEIIMTDQQAPQADAQQAQPYFGLEKIYVKDMSVEAPNAPQIFLEQGTPNIEVQLHTQTTGIEQGIFDCVLTVTVTAKVNDKTAYLVEVQQAGVFRVMNLPAEALEPALAVGCPNILFPYAREAVSDAITRAGFPPMYLQPVNFEAMYLQSKQQQMQAAGQTAH